MKSITSIVIFISEMLFTLFMRTWEQVGTVLRICAHILQHLSGGEAVREQVLDLLIII